MDPTHESPLRVRKATKERVHISVADLFANRRWVIDKNNRLVERYGLEQEGDREVLRTIMSPKRDTTALENLDRDELKERLTFVAMGMKLLREHLGRTPEESREWLEREAAVLEAEYHELYMLHDRRWRADIEEAKEALLGGDEAMLAFIEKKRAERRRSH